MKLNDIDEYLAEEAAKEQIKIDAERLAFNALSSEEKSEYAEAMRKRYERIEKEIEDSEE